MLAGVIGWPIKHSRSPAIHNAAALATGVPLLYTIFPVRSGEAPRAIDSARVLGLRGLSVTMPHKADVIPALDELTPAAEALGAVNHVTNEDGVMIGNNTDGDGFVRGFRHETGRDLADQRIAVIGSGGAARAIIEATARNGAAHIDVIARSSDRAKVAASVGHGRAYVADHSALSEADVVVNSTSVGMAGTDQQDQVPFEVSLLGDSAVVVDIVYTPLATPLLNAARSRGLVGVDGLAMLAGQAAAQFETWTGEVPPLGALIEAARKADATT